MNFSLLEKKALLGIAAIIVFVGLSLFEIGKRNLWFESKVTYKTNVKDADGLRVGSIVTIAGLRVGDVSNLSVGEDNKISITLSVMKAVANRIRKDSNATIFRAFIIGEKRIEIIPGKESEPILENGGFLPAHETTELAEFVTGKKLAELMSQVDLLLAGVTKIVTSVDEVVDKYHDGAFTNTLARVDPALEKLVKLTDDILLITGEVKKNRKDLPLLLEKGTGLVSNLQDDLFSNRLAKDTLTNVNKVFLPIAERQKLIADLLQNLDDLSKDLRKNPEFAQEAIDALRELTITLKALQKTWILEDKAKEVKNEQKTQP